MKKMFFTLLLCAALSPVNAETPTAPGSLNSLNDYVALEGDKAHHLIMSCTREIFVEKVGAAALLKAESDYAIEWRSSLWSALKSLSFADNTAVYRDIIDFSLKMALFAHDESQGDTLALTPSVPGYKPFTIPRTDISLALRNNSTLFAYMNKNLTEYGTSTYLLWSGSLGQCKEYIDLTNQLSEELLPIDDRVGQSAYCLCWVAHLPADILADHVVWAVGVCDRMASLLINCTDREVLLYGLRTYYPICQFFMTLIAGEPASKERLDTAIQLLERIKGPLLSHAAAQKIDIEESTHVFIQQALDILRAKQPVA